MPKKKACDICGKVHVDNVRPTSKGYVCSICIAEGKYDGKTIDVSN